MSAVTESEVGCIPTPTDEQIKAYVEFVQRHGEQRCRTTGKDFNPADFAAGAMAFFFVTGCQVKIPASWVFGIMAGGNPFDGKSAQEDE